MTDPLTEEECAEWRVPGVDRIVQRSMMGHSSESQTERYAGVRLEDKAAAVLRVIQGGK